MILNTECIDISRFSDAVARVALEERLSEGFSVIAEGSVHKAIKLYVEPRAEKHEVPLLGGVADVYNENGVFEVQTGSFKPLAPKLRRFLPEHKVTIVHPFRVRTRHRWLDRESGEIITPKSAGGSVRSLYSVGRELYAIRDLIGDPNLTVRIIAYECDEYRVLDGWDKTKRRGATLLGRTPTALLGEIELSTLSDYTALIPSALDESFLAKDYMRAVKSRSRYDALNLKLLEFLGLIERVGKQGNAYIYRRTTV